MDLDAYVIAHGHEWDRLDRLSRQTQLSGAESDELVERYQQVATHLSVIRTSAPDAALVSYLSSMLARARSRSVGTRVTTWRSAGRFFAEVFPAALYRLRWWWIGCLVANVVVIAVMMLWLLNNPTAEQSLLSPQEIDQLVDHDFEDYYSTYASSHFALQVWINNAWVSALCLALGILGFPVVLLLYYNITNLAVIGAIMTQHDHAGHFWGLILPHGMLELTAVFVAGGVGIRLFWSWIEPGPRTRTQSVAREGRTAATVALGLVVVLLVSGIIEGFVTPSGLPTWGRITVGALAEVAFLAYVFVLGRAAHARGQTGDIDDALLEDRVATAD